MYTVITQCATWLSTLRGTEMCQRQNTLWIFIINYSFRCQ